MSDRSLPTRQSLENVVLDCINMLYQEKDPTKAIFEALQKLGESLGVDHIFLFQMHDNHVYNNTYDWCREGSSSKKLQLHAIPTETLKQWSQQLNGKSHILLQASSSLLPDIQSMAIGSFEIGGKPSGYFGIADPPAESETNLSSAMEALRRFAVIAFQKNSREQSLQWLSIYDNLTGVYNRNKYISDVQMFTNQDCSIGVAYLDINGLKKTNDIYGHSRGDKVLIQCTEAMRSVFHDANIYRLGGDEFIILCFGKSKEHFIEQIRMLNNQLKEDPLCQAAIGYQWEPTLDNNLEELISTADSKMYEDKARFYENSSQQIESRHPPVNLAKKTVPISNDMPSGKPKAKKWQILVGIAALILCLSLFAGSSILYLSYIKRTVRQDAKSNLAELSNHISQSLYGEIDSTNNVLDSIKLVLPSSKFSSEEELMSFLNAQSEHWKFYDIALADGSGVWYHSSGNKDMLYDRNLLYRALEEQQTVHDFFLYRKEDCVIFVSPLENCVINGKNYIAISGSYAIKNWNTLMEVSVYDNQAVTNVITSDGVMITRSSSNNSTGTYNYIQSLRNAKFEEGITFDSLTQNLKEGKSIQAYFERDGQSFYLSCTPIGFNDWSLAFTVPANIVNQASDNMIQSTILICSGLVVVFVCLFIIYQWSQRRTKKKLWNMAYRDEVTGGANKHKFELDAAVLLAEKNRQYTLVYMNIRQFKLLNDRYGKKEADHILLLLQGGLNKMLREKECCGRLTADNFVILMEGADEESVQERLQTFVKDYSVLTTSTGLLCTLRFAFGLYQIEDGSWELTQIIDRANLAMKTAPLSKSMGIAVYTPSMLEQAAREKEIGELLLNARIQEEFYICLQPKIHLATGKVWGAEALARWNCPSKGIISPGDFIPVAEKMGLICDIDWMAFEQTCRMMTRWLDEGKELIPVSFNVSKIQLDIPHFLDHYKRVLANYHIPPSYLEFEFTESLLYENSDILRQAVKEIHEMGCKCSIDDFGFGYSSLGLLGQFEADVLKLDRSFFLCDPEHINRNNTIIQQVIRLAEGLNMRTVAEGVEDLDQVDMLKNFECDAIQGYVYSKPLTIPAFEAFIEEKNHEKGV